MERQARGHQQSGPCAQAGHRHGVPAFFAVRDADRRREHRAGARSGPRQRTAGAHPRGLRQVRPAARPRPPCAFDVGRRATAGGDRALPAAGPAPADHGRADVGADPAGGRETVRDAAAARGRGLQHPLHQPQARRNPRAVPPRDGVARRQGHRRMRSPAGVVAGACADDDRRRSAPPAPPRSECERRRRARRRPSDAPVRRPLRHRAPRCQPHRSHRRDRRHRGGLGQWSVGIAGGAFGRAAPRRCGAHRHRRHARRATRRRRAPCARA